MKNMVLWTHNQLLGPEPSASWELYPCSTYANRLYAMVQKGGAQSASKTPCVLTGNSVGSMVMNSTHQHHIGDVQTVDC
ncbi:hypothetical protein PEC106568_32570 [Pectobacterium carotovorum subsp. carotovorum]|nr:hypothetical protein PEC106568_32570 [Pectobacterium carotovorum subsp. carotovorum]